MSQLMNHGAEGGGLSPETLCCCDFNSCKQHNKKKDDAEACNTNGGAVLKGR